MSGKFGWEKANRQDAAKRAKGPNPYPTRRQKTRKPKKQQKIASKRPAMFYRHQCPQCQSLQVVTIIARKPPQIYKCDRCLWSSSIEPNSVLCKWTSNRTFQPLMAKGPSATPTACGQQDGTQRIRSAPGFDNGAFAGSLGYRSENMGNSHVSPTPDRTTALGSNTQTREVRG